MIKQLCWTVHICIQRGPDMDTFNINGEVWSAEDRGPIGAIETVACYFGIDPRKVLAATAEPQGSERDHHIVTPETEPTR